MSSSKAPSALASGKKQIDHPTREGWVQFISILINHKVAIPGAITLALLYLANISTNNQVSILLSTASTLMAGYTGGFVTALIEEREGTSTAIKKSHSAIRTLKTIHVKILNVSNRLNLTNSNKGLEEIENLITLISLDLDNAMSDWSDINPLLNNGVDRFEALAMLETQKIELKKKLKEAEKNRKDNAEMIDYLKKSITKNEKHKFEFLLPNNAGGIYSGETPTTSKEVLTGIRSLPGALANSCLKCGKIVPLGTPYCDECSRTNLILG